MFYLNNIKIFDIICSFCCFSDDISGYSSLVYTNCICMFSMGVQIERRWEVCKKIGANIGVLYYIRSEERKTVYPMHGDKMGSMQEGRKDNDRCTRKEWRSLLCPCYV